MGNFREFLKAVTLDPAMMAYLDMERSNKAHPNENYARELMELFALGVGNYTEKDVQEIARSFTGWILDARRARSKSIAPPWPIICSSPRSRETAWFPLSSRLSTTTARKPSRQNGPLRRR